MLDLRAFSRQEGRHEKSTVRRSGPRDRAPRPDSQPRRRPARQQRAGPQRRAACRATARRQDRKSVVKGKSVSVRVDLGGRRIIKKKSTEEYKKQNIIQ